MSRLDQVKSWMRWYGWTNDGGPGAELIVHHEVIARHGDAKWRADVDEAMAIEERLKLRNENSS